MYSIIFEKSTFGSVALAKYLCKLKPDEVELVGVCTDICVISNALMIKSFLSETKICVRFCRSKRTRKYKKSLRNSSSTAHIMY